MDHIIRGNLETGRHRAPDYRPRQEWICRTLTDAYADETTGVMSPVVGPEFGSSVHCERPSRGCSHGKGNRQGAILAPHGPELPRQSPSLAAGFRGGSPGWIRRTLTLSSAALAVEQPPIAVDSHGESHPGYHNQSSGPSRGDIPRRGKKHPPSGSQPMSDANSQTYNSFVDISGPLL
jgi:hypothetical protein